MNRRHLNDNWGGPVDSLPFEGIRHENSTRENVIWSEGADMEFRLLFSSARPLRVVISGIMDIYSSISWSIFGMLRNLLHSNEGGTLSVMEIDIRIVV
ncbi:hypothetical protein AVEN_203168-1 [Araneus ventricosus]|uniref:Uncharacterized protein n=1 Tax=Araneus ventricosus TaxID=182803 RepID=A0A4Y2CI28_ARAVE|nr:hypothetical protein AVEN_203168-1 [Araneus ventricosus]